MKKTLLFAAILSLHAGAPMAAEAVREPAMVAIPAGSFAMGDPVTKGTLSPTPVHQVRIAAFQMSKYEVTVSQFRQFAEATGYQAESTCWKLAPNQWGMDMGPANWRVNAYSQGEQHPVKCVSWLDAKTYTAWLAAQTGKAYRLPSEAEWEYAARAGTEDQRGCAFSNTRDRTGSAAIAKLTGKPAPGADCDDGAAFTSVVGSYQPNAFGLHDMLGNVAEFVEDCQHDNYDGAPTDGSAWTTGCSRNMKVRRGGGWAEPASSAWRGHTGPDNASSFDGFRVAL